MIDLYTADTPNGKKISIMLEEISVPYRVFDVDLSAQEHKEPWFLRINPNGKIPAIVDNERNGLAVFESGAIIIYLAEKSGKFLSPEPELRTVCFQWLIFQVSAVGPMQGQLNVFSKYAPEKIPYAIKRYTEETRRIYSVLDGRLSETEYLAGDCYSVADISTWPWIDSYKWSGISIDDFPNLRRWRTTVGKRPAVIRGNAVPENKRGGETEQEKIKRISKLLP